MIDPKKQFDGKVNTRNLLLLSLKGGTAPLTH
jgi:hypothetical protein